MNLLLNNLSLNEHIINAQHILQILCESVINRRCKWKKSHSYLPCIVIALGGFSFCKQSFGKSS